MFAANTEHSSVSAAEDAPTTTVIAPKGFQLGPDLDGYFDIAVLNPPENYREYRYAFPSIMQELRHEQEGFRSRPGLIVNLTIEFGRESGMAEIDNKQAEVQERIQLTIGRFTASQLATTAGKRMLKEDIMLAINSVLKTAQVRQVYYTMFNLAS